MLLSLEVGTPLHPPPPPSLNTVLIATLILTLILSSVCLADTSFAYINQQGDEADANDSKNLSWNSWTLVCSMLFCYSQFWRKPNSLKIPETRKLESMYKTWQKRESEKTQVYGQKPQLKMPFKISISGFPYFCLFYGGTELRLQ